MASQGTRERRRSERARGFAAAEGVQTQRGAAVSARESARIAIQRANCAWEGGPRRMRELCNVPPEAADWPTRGMVPVGAPVGGSEFFLGLRRQGERFGLFLV
jgi:hypothetical protein